MQDQESGDVCSVCKKPVKGGFDVVEGEGDEGFTIAIVATPDRDFNVCDACNVVVHFKCSQHPETGYCDGCFARYNPEDTGSASGRAQ
jgi:hypothetical protein